MDWRDIPLNMSKRVTGLLDRYRIVTLRELDRLAVTAYVVCPETGELLPALEEENFEKRHSQLCETNFRN